MSKLTGLMLGILLFSMVVVGTSEFIKGFTANYDDGVIESDWASEFDYINNMTSISDEMSNTIEANNTNWATGGFRIGGSVLGSVLQLPKFISDIFGRLGERLQLPQWVVSYVIIIMVIILIFIIAAALMRWWI